MRYARLMPPRGHRVMLCLSSHREDYQTRRGRTKIIFDNEAAARACAAELEALGGSPLCAYPCPRSRNGHYHLTSDLDGTGYHPPQTRVQLRAALRDLPDDAEHHRYHVIIAIRGHGEAACSRRSPEAGSTLRFRLAESTAIAAELVPMHRRCAQAGCHLRWPETAGEPGDN
jgi:hypothetical protein